jgi:16S rRNA processing protein RimM
MNRGVFFAMEITDSFYVGYISKSRGLKGEVQVFFEYDEYDALDLDVLFLEIDHKLVPFFVQHITLHPNRTAYVMFEDIDHIDKAQRLVRKKIYLPNSKKPVRDPDDFRITDLQGYTAVDRTYGELGVIVTVHEYPQQFVAVVLYKGNEIMFPITEGLILGIDRDSKRLDVDLPDGLIDVYST